MIPSHLIPSLAAVADAAVDAALINGAPGQHKPTGEPGYVAAVVLGAIPDMAAGWRPILRPHGFTVKFTGVFCHQSPMVDFTDSSGHPQRCELSDLLVVVDDLTGSVPGRRWAVLIQAKMAKPGGGKTLSGVQDLAQLDLMSQFPAFTLPASYAPGARDFSTCKHAGALADSGQYGLISNSSVTEWHQQPAQLSMPAGGHHLGSFIAGMVETGQTGFGREATGVADDWSRTVEELITVTSAQAFNYAAGFPGSRPRQVMAFALALDPDHLAPPGFMLYLHDRYWRRDMPSGGRPEGPGEPDDGPGGGGISFVRLGIGRLDG